MCWSVLQCVNLVTRGDSSSLNSLREFRFYLFCLVYVQRGQLQSQCSSVWNATSDMTSYTVWFVLYIQQYIYFFIFFTDLPSFLFCELGLVFWVRRGWKVRMFWCFKEADVTKLIFLLFIHISFVLFSAVHGIHLHPFKLIVYACKHEKYGSRHFCPSWWSNTETTCYIYCIHSSSWMILVSPKLILAC